MKVCLITTYELGHQPFGIASPARWLEDAGAEVDCIDLAVDCLNEDAVGQAGLIAIYLPMHTATRLAAAALPKIRALNAGAHLAFYGLYATVNKAYTRAGRANHTCRGGGAELGAPVPASGGGCGHPRRRRRGADQAALPRAQPKRPP